MSPKVVILGARGSVPVSSEEFLCYGGATTCVLIQSADQTIILDAGTGMLMLPTYLKPEDADISLLLSHGHVDHLLGFSMCPSVFDSARSFHIYAAERSGSDGESYLQSLMSPLCGQSARVRLVPKSVFILWQRIFRLDQFRWIPWKAFIPAASACFD